MSRTSASLLTNPVYASILGFSIIGWGLSLGPAFTVETKMFSSTWLAIVVNGLFIITYGIIIGTGMLTHYRLALLAYSAASLSRIAGEAALVIQSGSISYQIMAAGFLVQSLALIFFIAAVGQGDGTAFQAVRTSSGSQVRYARAAAAIAAAELQQQHQQQSMGTPYSNMTPSAGASFAYPTQLPAMPLAQMPPHVAVPVIQQPPMSAVPTAPPASVSTTPAVTQPSDANAENAGQSRPAPPPRISTISTATISTRATTYAYKARAIYSYQASPDDPNEISFNKNEIVDIVDTAGKWWQAKKSNGMVGIVPSNYLEII